MGFASTADWITEVVTNGKSCRYDWIKTVGGTTYTAGRWYDMALVGQQPMALTYGEWLANPTPSSASFWTLGAGWTYNANTFVLGSGATNTLSQNIGVVAGRSYRCSINITAVGGTGIKMVLSGTSGATYTTTGVKTETIVCGAGATGMVITPISITATATVSAISVIEVLGAQQLIDTNPCGAMFHGGNVSTDTKHIMTAGVQGSAATMTGTWLLCDYLMCYPYIDMNQAASQTLENTGFSLPRYTDGVGVRAFFVTTNGPSGATQTNMTYNYTNQAGSTALGQTPAAQMVVVPSSIVGHLPITTLAVAGNYGPFLPMAPGDNGIRSVQTLQFTVASLTASYGALVLCKPLLSIPMQNPNVTYERDYINQMANMVRVYDGAYLNWLFLPSQATVNGSQANGYLEFCWG